MKLKLTTFHLMGIVLVQILLINSILITMFIKEIGKTRANVPPANSASTGENLLLVSSAAIWDKVGLVLPRSEKSKLSLARVMEKAAGQDFSQKEMGKTNANTPPENSASTEEKVLLVSSTAIWDRVGLALPRSEKGKPSLARIMEKDLGQGFSQQVIPEKELQVNALWADLIGKEILARISLDMPVDKKEKTAKKQDIAKKEEIDNIQKVDRKEEIDNTQKVNKKEQVDNVQKVDKKEQVDNTQKVVKKEEANKKQNIAKKETIDKKNVPDKNEQSGEREFIATCYDLSYESCGKYPTHPQYGITKSGTRAQKGRTIAVDPAVIPLGSNVSIEFPEPYKHLSGLYVAEDTGNKVKGNIIDVFMGESSFYEMKKFGRRKVKVKIIYPKAAN